MRYCRKNSRGKAVQWTGSDGSMLEIRSVFPSLVVTRVSETRLEIKRTSGRSLVFVGDYVVVDESGTINILDADTFFHECEPDFTSELVNALVDALTYMRVAIDYEQALTLSFPEDIKAMQEKYYYACALVERYRVRSE